MERGQGTPGWDGGDHGARTKVTQGDGGDQGDNRVRIKGREGGQWGGQWGPHLFLQIGRLEGEQELLDVVLAELVDAARVDGPAQELVHLVLGVEGLLGTAAGARQGGVKAPCAPPSQARPPSQNAEH